MIFIRVLFYITYTYSQKEGCRVFCGILLFGAPGGRSGKVRPDFIMHEKYRDGNRKIVKRCGILEMYLCVKNLRHTSRKSIAADDL